MSTAATSSAEDTSATTAAASGVHLTVGRHTAGAVDLTWPAVSAKRTFDYLEVRRVFGVVPPRAVTDGEEVATLSAGATGISDNAAPSRALVSYGVFAVSSHGVAPRVASATTAVDPEEQTADRDAPAGTVTGRVTDKGGRPLAGVVVEVSGSYAYVFDGGLAGTGGSGVPTDPIRTGADGRFSYPGVDPGTSSVCFDTDTSVTGGTAAPAGFASRCVQRIDVADAGTTDIGDVALVADKVGGVLTGNVTDSGGAPLHFAFVNLTAAGDDYPTRQLLTDSAGRYAAHLAPGQWTVCYATTYATGAASPAGVTGRCHNGTITVAPGATTRADDALAAGASIAGQLKLGNRIAPAGVTLSLSGAGYSDFGHAVTGTNGRFTVPNLSGGHYSVCVYGANDVTSGDTGYVDGCPVSADVAAGATTTAVQVALPSAGAVTGTVRNAAGTGLANRYVSSGNAYAVTASDGTYTLRGIAPTAKASVCTYAGGSFCWHDAAGRTTVRIVARQLLTGIDIITGVAASTGTISIHVTDTRRTPLHDVNVVVFSACTGMWCGSQPLFGSAPVTAVQTALTDANGDFAATGLAPGDYAVCVYGYFAGGGASASGYVDKCTAYGSFPYRVTASSSRALTVAMAAGGAISGRVTNVGGTPAPGSHTYVPGSNLENHNGRSLPHDTESDGTYTVWGVAPGTQHACFSSTTPSAGAPYGNLPTCWKNFPWHSNADVAASTPIQVVAGRTNSNVSVTLPAAGAVSGRVTEPSGAGLGNVFISFIDAGGNYVGSGQTDSDGQFTATGLPSSGAGSYTACFYGQYATVGGTPAAHADGCWLDVPWDGSYPTPTGTPVSVQASAVTSGINQVLPAA